MRRRDEMWASDHDSQGSPARRIALEITLRKIEPLDDLVYFIEGCTARLEETFVGTGRCTVTICPVWYPNRMRLFEVKVRFVSSEAYAEVRHVDRDLFAVTHDAFEAVRARLTRHDSGVHSRMAVLGEAALAEADAAVEETIAEREQTR